MFGAHTISGRIRLLVFLLTSCSTLMVLTVFTFLFRDELETARLDELSDSLAFQDLFISNWMADQLHEVEFLAQLYSVRSGNAELMRTTFGFYDQGKEDVSSVACFDAAGNALADSLPLDSPYSSRGLNISDREYFKQGKAGRSWISGVLTARTTGNPVVIFSVPYRGEAGAFSGVVIATVRLTTIDKMLAGSFVGRSGNSYLVDVEGRVLTSPRRSGPASARTGAEATGPAVPTLMDEQTLRLLRADTNNPVRYRNADGVDVYGQAIAIKEGEWYLVNEVDAAEIGSSYRATMIATSVAALLTVLLLAPLGLRLARDIKEPVETLSDYAQAMARDEPEATCIKPPGRDAPTEVRLLHEAFCRMKETITSTIEQLEHTSITDPLTGLPNRRHMMEEGRRLLDASRRAGAPCVFFMLDVDHFKKVNDRYGHVCGDQVLKGVARIIQATVRTSDLAARIGGEEFAVLAPNADAETGRILGERIRANLESAFFEFEDQTIRCTVSIGLAEFPCPVQKLQPPQGEAMDDVLQRADAALYAAKHAGRNRLVSWSETLPKQSGENA